MNGILSVKSPTAKYIAEALDIPFWRSYDMPEDTDKVIRWGVLSRAEKLSLNSAAALSLTSDKEACRLALNEGGVPTPTVVGVDEFGWVWGPVSSAGVVGRPERHTRGRGFHMCWTGEQIVKAQEAGANYWSYFYPKTNEYRVHVAGGRTILFSAKEGGMRDRCIWNHEAGFTFRHMHRNEWLNNENLMNIQRACKKAMKIVGLDFAAIDVMADAGPGYAPFVISEINSAPALSELAAEKYIKYFREWLNADA